MLDSLRAIIIFVGVLLLAGAAALLGQMMAGANELDPLAFTVPAAAGLMLIVVGRRIRRHALMQAGAGAIAGQSVGDGIDLGDLGDASASGDASSGSSD